MTNLEFEDEFWVREIANDLKITLEHLSDISDAFQRWLANCLTHLAE